MERGLTYHMRNIDPHLFTHDSNYKDKYLFAEMKVSQSYAQRGFFGQFNVCTEYAKYVY